MSDPGAFLQPTAGTSAASACSSPSIFSVGSMVFATFVASITLSTTSCVAEPFVEKEHIATRGSAKPATDFAVCAAHTAICPSWLASGTGVTATSANTSTPFSPYSGLSVIISMAPDTHEMPGAVLMICSAGRRVSPVVESAPEICPSAPSDLIMRQPRYSGFFTISRAFSIVMPFFSRSFVSSAAISSDFS